LNYRLNIQPVTGNRIPIWRNFTATGSPKAAPFWNNETEIFLMRIEKSFPLPAQHAKSREYQYRLSPTVFAYKQLFTIGHAIKGHVCLRIYNCCASNCCSRGITCSSQEIQPSS